MNSPSCFIALEGIDGSGTTTQAARLAMHLRSLGRTVVQTAEPSDGPVGRSCRAALQTDAKLPDAALALMFAADRLQHLDACILPALQRDEVVICDRYLMSTLAYQGLTLEEAWLCAINSAARAPDLTLLVDLPTPEAQRRVQARGGVEEQFDAAPLQVRIAERYRGLARKRLTALGPVVVVDGTGSPDAVTKRLLEALAPLTSAPQVL